MFSLNFTTSAKPKQRRRVSTKLSISDVNFTSLISTHKKILEYLDFYNFLIKNIIEKAAAKKITMSSSKRTNKAGESRSSDEEYQNKRHRNNEVCTIVEKLIFIIFIMSQIGHIK